MKRLAIIAAALMLTLGLAQCKKETTTEQPANEGNLVHITVNVDNGSKADVNPATGAVSFRSGDKLYVGYNGAYAGVLDFNGSAFSGDITIDEPGQRLYFYYLGGMEATIVNGVYSANISDQTSNYPVISCGYSVPYTVGKNEYSTILMNQCALVKFNLSAGTDAAIRLSGLYTKATIDFDNGVITPGTQGTITLHSGASNTERWAILLPQSGVSATATISGYNCSITTFPAVVDNDYYTEGVSISMTVPVPANGISRARYSDDSAPSNFISLSEADAKALADAEMTATGALGYICIYALEGGVYKWIASNGRTGQNSTISEIADSDDTWDLVELWFDQGYDYFIWFTVSMTVQEPAIGFSKARYSVDSAPSNFISVSQATAKASADAEKTATGALGYICIYALEGGEYKWIASDGRTGQNSTISEIADSDDTWDLVELWFDQGYDDFIWFTVE